MNINQSNQTILKVIIRYYLSNEWRRQTRGKKNLPFRHFLGGKLDFGCGKVVPQPFVYILTERCIERALGILTSSPGGWWQGRWDNGGVWAHSLGGKDNVREKGKLGPENKTMRTKLDDVGIVRMGQGQQGRTFLTNSCPMSLLLEFVL